MADIMTGGCRCRSHVRYSAQVAKQRTSAIAGCAAASGNV